MTNHTTIISIVEILEIIKKNMWIILTIFAVSFGAMFSLVNYVLKPEYRATTQILVVQNTEKEEANLQNSEVQANLQMINTYSSMLRSPLVLNEVSHKFNDQYSVGRLKDEIVVANDQNSQILNIHVEDKNQAVAVAIANQVARSFKEKLPEVMTDKTVTIMSTAEMSEQTQPVFPNKPLMYLLSIVIGAILSILICFIKKMMDTTIKTEEQIVEKLNLVVLGMISNIPNSQTNTDGGFKNEKK
ncbi:YveK family protein [Listeria cornellensis]|uniref:YveK family protein n=1 Tax=Listeria cornellensis TaxID=1494961 RepID=UPI0004AC7072|nr:Wzz/FepE/Etk N-terminal domain-containing protein [Listeria cornellensis]